MSREDAQPWRLTETVELTGQEACALVYIVAFMATEEAEHLTSMPVSASATDLLAISARCARISRFAAINDQLAWRAQRSDGDERFVITSTADVLLELAVNLEATARDRLRFPDDQLENLAFGPAARAIRACLGTEETPTTTW